MTKRNIQKQYSLQRGKQQCRQQQRGFTLIEIAIVLVIIGFLLGGVLKGQELINTAKVRALNNNVDGITAAWFSFQDRYRAFPGDYTQAIVNLPGIPAGGNGDGNGQVDADGERAHVWVHLQAAGYITGNFDASGVLADQYGCPVGSCPDNGFGAGMNLSFGELSQSQVVGAHELVTGRGIPVEVLAELDRKIDDGGPQSGVMRLGIGSSNGWTTTEAGVCSRDVSGTEVYELQSPSANCAAVFRNF